jgi:glucokinase
VKETVRLVADVGGTNIRLGLAVGAHLDSRTLVSMRCDGLAGLGEAISSYLDTWPGRPRPEEVCVAIAGPIEEGRVRMTNRDWDISKDKLQRELGVRRLALINDFVAVSMAVPGLQPADWVAIGDADDPMADAPIAVLGPGTGLGVGALVPHAGGWIPIATEGGHAGLAPADQQEIELLGILMRKEQPVSLERVLCGPGLSVLYAAVSELEDGPRDAADAAEIISTALAEPGSFCARVLGLFCAMLGTLAGNLALTFGARGGVYLAGGIFPRMIAFLAASRFRARFENQELRYRDYVSRIPTRLIVAEHPGLTGALAYLLRH